MPEENLDKKIDTTLGKGVEGAKEVITKPFPKPPSLTEKSSANALKERLEWGEPALTIVDVRDREAFNQERITGAVTMPMDTVVQTAKDSLESVRDIYVYGETDQKTAEAASALRSEGFQNVAQLEGGLPGWKAIGGPTEGSQATTSAIRLNQQAN